MAKRNLNGSIELTKLIHVKMEMKGQSGNLVKGIFIPFEPNYVIKGKKGGAYINIINFINDEVDQYGNIASIKQSVDSKTYKDADEEEKKKLKELPYLGNLKDFSGSGSENEGAASESVFTPESDDLPF